MPLPPHASVGEPGTETSAWGITLHRSSLAVTKVLPRPLQYSFPPIPLSKKRVYCGKEYCYTCGERALAHGGEMNTSIPCYGIIPARYDSSRFPGKPLADIWGRPMFWHVYAHAKRASVLRNIVLATDDERIAEAALEWEIPCVMTRRDHASGTDRVFEAASKLGVEPHAVIVNIQGDEPALDPAVIEQLIRPFLDGTVQVSTLATPISPERAASPNQVKVVTAANGDALYFSRSRIPFDREGGDGEILGHIGLYAFRMGALERFVSLPQSPLEKREKLEQLRFLENGVPIRVARVEGYEAHGVDTPEDLETIRELLAEHTCKSCVR